MNHTYYIPATRKVYGSEKDNLEIVAMLYAFYISHLEMNKDPERYDGASFCHGSNEHIIINNRIMIITNCNGKGTGNTFILE